MSQGQGIQRGPAHRCAPWRVLVLVLLVPSWVLAQTDESAVPGAPPSDPLAQAQALLSEDPAAALVLADRELARAEQAGDRLAQSRIEELRAQIFVALRRFGDAGVAYDDAISLAEEARAPARALAILSNLSKLHFRIGEYHGAMDVEQRSLDIARRAGLPLQEAQSLNNIGVLHRRQGDPEQALNFYQQSLSIREQIDDLRGVAQSLNNIGIVHKNWGNYFQALEYHLRALNIRRGFNRAVETAESLSNIGIIYRNLGDLDKALEYFEESRAVLGEQLADRERVTSALNIGHTLLLQQRYDAAEQYLQDALAIARELSLRPQIAEILELMGKLALAGEDAGTAQARYAQALRLAEEVGEPSQVASILIHQATAYLAEGQLAQAQPLLEQADQLAAGLAEPSISRDLALVRSRLLAAQGRYPEALSERDRYEALALQLVDAGNSRRMADLEASLALQRSEADLNAALLQNNLQEEMVERQRIIGAGLIFAVIATLAVIVLLVGRFRLVRKVNVALSEQSAHSRRQHDELSLAHSELERRAEELSIAATTDPLTGLYNRYFLIRELQRLLDQARLDGSSLSVVIMDYDHFKNLNDTHTHLGGDRVLRDGAQLMREQLGANAVIGRFGGEEFLALLPDTTLEGALQRAEALRECVENHRFKLRGRAMQVTLSLGVADLASAPQLDLDGLLHVADEALYQAKREGRNRAVAATPFRPATSP